VVNPAIDATANKPKTIKNILFNSIHFLPEEFLHKYLPQPFVLFERH